jgi:hypothetical protein
MQFYLEDVDELLESEDFMYQSIPAVPIPPPPGISHFWKENGYVPTQRKDELC